MQALERLLAMDEASWERHANPWSGWTRFPILPALALAVWARVWIGWWCVVPVGLLLAWTWANPRAFPVPARTTSWASRAVLGERVWLARRAVPIPAHHAAWAGGLSVVAALGAVPVIWGVAALEVWPLALGLVVAMGAKLWFCDRMAWLFADMARVEPRYAGWMRPAPVTGRARAPISPL